MDTAASFVNILMKDYARGLNMSSGWWGKLMVVGEPPEMFLSFPVHSIDRRETFWAE